MTLGCVVTHFLPVVDAVSQPSKLTVDCGLQPFSLMPITVSLMTMCDAADDLDGLFDDDDAGALPSPIDDSDSPVGTGRGVRSFRSARLPASTASKKKSKASLVSRVRSAVPASNSATHTRRRNSDGKQGTPTAAVVDTRAGARGGVYAVSATASGGAALPTSDGVTKAAGAGGAAVPTMVPVAAMTHDMVLTAMSLESVCHDEDTGTTVTPVEVLPQAVSRQHSTSRSALAGVPGQAPAVPGALIVRVVSSGDDVRVHSDGHSGSVNRSGGGGGGAGDTWVGPALPMVPSLTSVTAAAAVAPVAVRRGSGNTSRTTPLRVLVVDDESSNRRLVSRMLQRLPTACDCTLLEDGDEIEAALLAAGYRLPSGASAEGAGGSSTIPQQPFDAILLDIMMKRTNGEAVGGVSGRVDSGIVVGSWFFAGGCHLLFAFTSQHTVARSQGAFVGLSSRG